MEKKKVRLTTDQFVLKAREIHGDRFDYSKVNYINTETPVTIICPEHGPFSQRPDVHLRAKKCCPSCSGNVKMNNQQFIERAQQLYGDTFDYSKVDYKNIDTKVIIICRKHGKFEQAPYVHLHSSIACPKCQAEKKKQSLALGRESFISRAIKVHENKYDYSKVEYVNNRTNVEIVCPIHGTFLQTPINHLKGCGCNKCSHADIGQKRRLSFEEFVRRSREIHGDKYSYDKVLYKGNDVPVVITCPIHGDFEKRPSDHWAGSGCNACAGIVSYTTETFIERAKMRHGEKYDYSKTIYRGMAQKIQYRCRRHGLIEQLAYDHLKSGCRFCANNVPWNKHMIINYLNTRFGDAFGFECTGVVANEKDKITIVCSKHGKSERSIASLINCKTPCVKCSRYAARNDIRVLYNQFINKCTRIHERKYDYRLVHKDMVLKDDVKILCPEHGVFTVSAELHYSGGGVCPKCIGRDRTTEEWKKIFQDVHGDKYIYPENIDYKTITDKIEIICPKHGPFVQELNAHRLGQGCPYCKESHMEKKVAAGLRNKDISFERQKKFKWLRFVGPQSLDFYLPDYNIAIECQGFQHFKIKGNYYNMDEDLLILTQERDKNKFDLCMKNGIELLYYCTKAEWIPQNYHGVIYTSIGSLIEAIINHKRIDSCQLKNGQE